MRVMIPHNFIEPVIAALFLTEMVGEYRESERFASVARDKSEGGLPRRPESYAREMQAEAYYELRITRKGRKCSHRTAA